MLTLETDYNIFWKFQTCTTVCFDHILVWIKIYRSELKHTISQTKQQQ